METYGRLEVLLRYSCPPSGPATPISSSNKESEYQTDEEDLTKETEWIRVKHGAKKRKINETPSPTTSADPQKRKTAQTESEIKREPASPPMMVHGVKLYERLYGELTNQLSKESFQFKITNDEMVKINCNNSENYRKAIHVL
jgi:hypothetical protein